MNLLGLGGSLPQDHCTVVQAVRNTRFYQEKVLFCPELDCKGHS